MAFGPSSVLNRCEHRGTSKITSVSGVAPPPLPHLLLDFLCLDRILVPLSLAKQRQPRTNLPLTVLNELHTILGFAKVSIHITSANIRGQGGVVDDGAQTVCFRASCASPGTAVPAAKRRSCLRSFPARASSSVAVGSRRLRACQELNDRSPRESESLSSSCSDSFVWCDSALGRFLTVIRVWAHKPEPAAAAKASAAKC